MFWFQETLIAQILLPNSDNAFESMIPFNGPYIQQHLIKSITCDIIDKKDLQVAENIRFVNRYEFNKNGQLQLFYYTQLLKTIEKEFHHDAVYRKRRLIRRAYTYTKTIPVFDTISTTYIYDELNQMRLKRMNEGLFYDSFYYDYHSDGKLQKEMRYKETNATSFKNDFKIGTQINISEEHFEYKLINKHQFKKTCFNNENRPYKEIIYNLNDDNQILNITEQYVVTWLTQTYSFEYNAKHQMTKAISTSNSNGLKTLIKTYEYDSNDCLLTEKEYKNNLLFKEISYLTDSSKKTTSYIIRDPNEKTMRIVKLTYAFYE
jgi:hypothetical protein